MKQVSLVLVVLSMALLAACQTGQIPQLSSGNRAEGVVDLTYEYDWPDIPWVYYGPARDAARDECRSWGYLNVATYREAQSECIKRNREGSCLRTRVTVFYDCVRAPRH